MQSKSKTSRRKKIIKAIIEINESRKSMQQRTRSLKKNGKIDQTLRRLIQKRDDTSYQYHNEMWDFNTDPENIKRLISEYYEQLYKQKFNNLDKMNQFLKKHNHILPSRKWIIWIPITITDIKLIIYNSKKKKSPILDDITGEFYQTLKEELRHSAQYLPEKRKGGNISQFALWR